jgi:hypothetical protein
MPLYNPDPEVSTWFSLNLANGWTQHSNQNFPPIGYCKDNETSIVYLRGILANGTIGQTAAILPSGYRPTWRLAFPVLSYAASQIVFGQIAIDPSGDVQVTVGGNSVIGLNGIFFRTDQ